MLSGTQVFAHSRQPGNLYTGGSNEAAQMQLLVNQCAFIGRAERFDIAVPPRIDYNKDGVESFYDNYMWINNHAAFAKTASFFHSNAMGDSMILFADEPASRAVALRFQEILNRRNFMPFGDKWTLNSRQVSELTKTRVPIRILFEFGQHDKSEYAQWLRENIASGWLARQFMAAWFEYAGVIQSPNAPNVITPQPADNPRIIVIKPGLIAPKFPLGRCWRHNTQMWYGPKSHIDHQVSGFSNKKTDGSIGSDGIYLWQKTMRDFRGWKISADGLWGSESDRVCRAFQAQKDLFVDGKLGVKTWAYTWEKDVTNE